MAHAWKACWCNSLTSSNLVSSARIGTPETVEIIRFPGFCFGSFRLPVPSRYPPFRHLWPRPAARVTYRNRRFRKRHRPPPAACSSSKSDRVPCVPSVGRFESLHVLRAVFSFWFATIPASVSQAHRSEYRSTQREGPPGPPPMNATRTHTGAITAHSNRQSTPSYIDKKPRNVRRSDGSEGDNGKPRRHPPPGIRQRTAPAPP